jgi:hypothetical protein
LCFDFSTVKTLLRTPEKTITNTKTTIPTSFKGLFVMMGDTHGKRGIAAWHIQYNMMAPRDENFSTPIVK